ncbi:hypothetical protein AMTRI_Chr01g130520 [Amborella trichopoda]
MLKKGKLLVGQKVEVRQLDEGLRGSWHPGVITSARGSKHCVEYDELLNQEGSSKLIEWISVVNAIGGDPGFGLHNYRGRIRPPPPPHDDDEKLLYGMCVDAMFEDAWWEGVILAGKSASEKSVFFPDEGDELRFGVEKLRVTCDWDEATGQWVPRGCWFLIELFDHNKNLLGHSVKRKKKHLAHSTSSSSSLVIKNIWFRLRMAMEFSREIPEWTCGDLGKWAPLVQEIMLQEQAGILQICGSELSLVQNAISHGEKEASKVALKDVSLKQNGTSQVEKEASKRALEVSSEKNGGSGHGMREASKRALKVSKKEPDGTSYGQRELLEIGLEISSWNNGTSNGEREPQGRSREIVRRAFESEYCPQAIKEYMVEFGEKGFKGCLFPVRERARRHLLAVGWRIKCQVTEAGKFLYYVSPNRERYYSLHTAILVCARQEQAATDSDNEGEGGLITESSIQEHGSHVEETEFGLMISLEEQSCGDLKKPRTWHKRKEIWGQASQKNDSYGDLRHSNLRSRQGCKKRRKNDATDFYSRKRRCGEPKEERLSLQHSTDGGHSKGAPRGQMSPCSGNLGVFSWMIDNKALLLRQSVCFLSEKDGHVMARGWITRKGIMCKCCKQVYSPSGFGAHAGGGSRAKQKGLSACIFLQDGRSLLQCQSELLSVFRSQSFGQLKTTPHCLSDKICSICHYGGDLILCDRCPSSFHLSCVGLEELPEGKWFCPSCRCNICGGSAFNSDFEQFMEKTIYVSLRALLGQSNPIGVGSLSVTILRSPKDDNGDLNASQTEIMIKYHSKLSDALDVLHECFNPIVESRTKTDLFSDVLFNKRIHGKKVAEMPLVGTRVQFRKQGMCRLLVHEIEKMLSRMEVEMLIVPAAPQLSETWRNSLGYTEMPHSKRSKFLGFTFLNFPDTTMFWKSLMKTKGVYKDLLDTARTSQPDTRNVSEASDTLLPSLFCGDTHASPLRVLEPMCQKLLKTPRGRPRVLKKGNKKIKDVGLDGYSNSSKAKKTTDSVQNVPCDDCHESCSHEGRMSLKSLKRGRARPLIISMRRKQVKCVASEAKETVNLIQKVPSDYSRESSFDDQETIKKPRGRPWILTQRSKKVQNGSRMDGIVAISKGEDNTRASLSHQRTIRSGHNNQLINASQPSLTENILQEFQSVKEATLMEERKITE